MIKSILFDLDGVLIEAKEIHYKTLNQAITEVVGEEYNISYQEHLSIYDGLKTNDKLDLLSQRKGLPSQSHKQIWLRKQELTVDELVRLRPNEKLISVFSSLKNIRS